MREILFKAKATDNGEWVEGSLINAFEYTCILQAEDKLHPTDYPYLDGDIGTFDGKATPVDPKTVGQYTGLSNTNGKKIFEGDILCYEGGSDYAVVKYRGDRAAFFVENEDGEEYLGEAWDTDVIVVGNIYDNPELIGGESR